MNMQMRLLSHRTLASIDLSYGINAAINAAITKCYNDRVGLKLVYLWILNNYFCNY